MSDIIIRPAELLDVPAMLGIYAPYVEETAVSFEYAVPSEEEFRARVEKVQGFYPWLVAEQEGRVVGYAYASPPYSRAAYRWCAEPSVYLRPEARGRGIGAKLYAALEKILALQGYQVLYALITSENTASLRFHEKQGYSKRAEFPHCGFKFGRWLGIYWYEKRTEPVKIPSNPPTPWPQLMHSDQKFSDILDILSLS